MSANDPNAGATARSCRQASAYTHEHALAHTHGTQARGTDRFEVDLSECERNSVVAVGHIDRPRAHRVDGVTVKTAAAVEVPVVVGATGEAAVQRPCSL